MSEAADAWRRMGQEHVLPPGTEFVRRTYTTASGEWDHDHCAMCMTKFSAKNVPDGLDGGYTTTTAFPRGEGYEWICPTCFDHFAEEFGWRVVD